MTASPVPAGRQRSRNQWLLGLAITFIVAGIISFYASASPDGLEYVAEVLGFSDVAAEHAVANGPLADYQVRGIENARFSGGLAGVIGSSMVLIISFGLLRVIRGHRHTETS